MSQKEKSKQVLRAIRQYVKANPDLETNYVRILVALERVVARLSSDPDLLPHLVFKGGFVLLKTIPSQRFTRDADILARGIKKAELIPKIEKALHRDLKDGLWYGEIEVIELPIQGTYGAYRLKFPFQIGEPKKHKDHKLPRLHIDIGFSDQLKSSPEEKKFSAILDYESPISWKIYPIEFTFSEKLHTFCERQSENSRAKDLYDMNLIFPLCKDRKSLKSAIEKTFQNRNTKQPESFYKLAKSINQTVLKMAWPGVLLVNEKKSFEEIWERFLKILENLDNEI